MADLFIENVSDTAFWIAHLRAEESKRPDALFQDPWAAQLAGERGAKIAKSIPWNPYVAWSVALRTCIIDDYIQAAIASGTDTIVNLGAGLDTRPYRMELPNTLRWIEVDQAQVITYKQERLRDDVPRCSLERSALTLADSSARKAFLAQIGATSKRALVLTEGVVPYLDSDEVTALANDLHAMACFQGWVLDYNSSLAQKYRTRQTSLAQHMKHAPFKFAPADWTLFFHDLGWRVQDMRYFQDEAIRFKRRMPMPPGWKWLITRFLWIFRSSKSREALKKMSGYALLSPA